MPGIDPGTSRMLSERSTTWATPPHTTYETLFLSQSFAPTPPVVCLLYFLSVLWGSMWSRLEFANIVLIENPQITGSMISFHRALRRCFEPMNIQKSRYDSSSEVGCDWGFYWSQGHGRRLTVFYDVPFVLSFYQPISVYEKFHKYIYIY